MDTSGIVKLMNELDTGDNKPKEFSDNDRMKLLEIDVPTAENIKRLDFKRTNFDKADYGEAAYKVIPLRDLVGINNRAYRANNWLELLFDLSKPRTFELYKSRDNFQRYINSLNEGSVTLPDVLYVNGSYYICGDGKHRLTIAKCIGLDNVLATVTTIRVS
jgi:hypothetical protein